MSGKRWVPAGEYGWKCGDYAIGKVFVDGCTLFEVWYQKELIASVDDFDDARAAARTHNNIELGGTA